MQEEVAEDLRSVFSATNRTKAVGVFPNENSCLRLISSILIDMSEKWETGWIYLDVSDGR